ncbi:MAG: hypothetical protein WCR54_00150 [Clostridia bacterium]
MNKFINLITIKYNMYAYRLLKLAINLELSYDVILDIIYQYTYCTKDSFVSKDDIEMTLKIKGISFVDVMLLLISSQLTTDENMELANQIYEEYIK